MNEKITCLCVYDAKKSNTIGIIHVHNIQKIKLLVNGQKNFCNCRW